MTTRQSLYFVRPFEVEIREETLPRLASHQVLVQSHLSAISAGTELLFLRGQVPAGMEVDASLPGMQQGVHYPLAYGYSCVGKVAEVGDTVDDSWRGQRVFAFHPHASAFVYDPAQLLRIPAEISDEQAAFLPNMETALNFTMDAAPLIGERVIVMGLGIVGLLTLFLLRQFPLAKLAAIDGYAKRLAIARQWGLDHLYSPTAIDDLAGFDPDLILEISSNPAALATAIELADFGTRILVGSWYGDKQAILPLGGSFHRNRVRIFSSQVSTVDGMHSNRWDKARRIHTAWQQLAALPASDLISHRLPIAAAAKAYALLDRHPEDVLQIQFTY